MAEKIANMIRSSLYMFHPCLERSNFTIRNDKQARRSERTDEALSERYQRNLTRALLPGKYEEFLAGKTDASSEGATVGGTIGVRAGTGG